MQNIRMIDRTPFRYERLTVTNGAVVGLTAALIEDAHEVYITVEHTNIRWRIDGGDPGVADGHVYTAGAIVPIILRSPRAIVNFRMLSTGQDAQVLITYFREA